MIFRNYKILLILFLPTIISNLFAQDYLSLTEAQNRLQYLTIEKAKIASEFDTVVKFELEQKADTSPKGEFETNQEYKNRILKNKELLAQIEIKYESLWKAKEDNISIQIRELLDREYIEPINIRLNYYYADLEIYLLFVQLNPYPEEVPKQKIIISPSEARKLKNNIDAIEETKKVGIFRLLSNGDYGITAAGFEFNEVIYEIEMKFQAKKLYTYNFRNYLKAYIPCFSRDSKSLVLARSDIYLIDLNTSGYRKITEEKQEVKYTDLLFSPDGKELIANSDMSLDVWDLESNSLIVSFKNNRSPINQIDTDFGIDINYKKSLLASGSGKKITLYDTKTWAIKDILYVDPPIAVVEALAFHPSGNLIAFQGKDNKIYLVNVNTKKIQKKLNAASKLGKIYSLKFSPDGKFLTVGSSPAVILDWIRDKIVFGTGINNPKFLSYSPDGNFLFVAGDIFNTINIGMPQSLRRRNFSGRNNSAGVFSPDGQYIANWNELWQVVKRKENGISIPDALIKLDSIITERNKTPIQLIAYFKKETGNIIQASDVRPIYLDNDYYPEFSIVSGDATWIYRRTGNRFELLLSEIYSFRSHAKTLSTLSNGWKDIEISWTLDQIETKITFKYDGKKYVEKSFRSSGIE